MVHHRHLQTATAPRPAALRRTLLVVAALLAALAALALRPGPATALTPGFMDPAFQTEQPDVFWGDMTALKAGVLRYDVYWREIAPQRPAAPRDPASPEYDSRASTASSRDAARTASQSSSPSGARRRGPARTRARRRLNGYAFAPNLDDCGDFVYAAADALLRQVRPRRRRPARRAAAGRATGRCGTSRTTSARSGRSAPATRSSRPRIYTGILNRGYAEIRRVEHALSVKLNVLGGADEPRLRRRRQRRGARLPARHEGGRREVRHRDASTRTRRPASRASTTARRRRTSR